MDGELLMPMLDMTTDKEITGDDESTADPAKDNADVL